MLKICKNNQKLEVQSIYRINYETHNIINCIRILLYFWIKTDTIDYITLISKPDS